MPPTLAKSARWTGGTRYTAATPGLAGGGPGLGGAVCACTLAMNVARARDARRPQSPQVLVHFS